MLRNKLLGALSLAVPAYIILLMIVNNLSYTCTEINIFLICKESSVSIELFLLAILFMFCVGWWLGFNEISKQLTHYCPYCGHKLPPMQFAKKARHAAFNIATCVKCGKECTFRGKKLEENWLINPKNTTQARKANYFILGISLTVVIATIIGVIIIAIQTQ